MANSAAEVDLSVVIPAYRSAGSIPLLLERLLRVTESLGRSYEIVIVDDASPDDTWSTLVAARKRHGDRLVLIRLGRNTGQHNALMCGFHFARGRLIATMDDDLQHPPEELPRLLQALEQDQLDLVYGNYRTKQHNLWRKIVTIPIWLFHRHLFPQSTVPTSFRLARRWLVESILSYEGPFTVVDGLFAWNTRQIGGVMIDHAPRALGRSTHSFPKLLGLAFNAFTNFSLLPIRWISAAGGIAAAVGIGLGILAATRSLGGPGEGLTAWLIAAVFFLGGLQLLSLGLLGEYVGRVHLTLSKKKQFTVQCVIPEDREAEVAI